MQRISLLFLLLCLAITESVAQRVVHIESNSPTAHVFADKEWIGTVSTSPFRIADSVNEIIVVQAQVDVWNGSPFVFELGDEREVTFRAHFDSDSDVVSERAMKSGIGVPVRRKKWIGYTAAGTSLVAGVLAIHFRTKADNRYQDFLETGSPQLKREVQRLDVQSGIALGAMQIGVGVIAFRLIF